MELGPQNHDRDGLSGPDSTMVVYVDPQGKLNLLTPLPLLSVGCRAPPNRAPDRWEGDSYDSFLGTARETPYRAQGPVLNPTSGSLKRNRIERIYIPPDPTSCSYGFRVCRGLRFALFGF